MDYDRLSVRSMLDLLRSTDGLLKFLYRDYEIITERDYSYSSSVLQKVIDYISNHWEDDEENLCRKA